MIMGNERLSAVFKVDALLWFWALVETPDKVTFFGKTGPLGQTVKHNKVL